MIVVFACSGPGAAEAIALAERLGLLALLGSVVAVVAVVAIRWALGSAPRSIANGLGGLLLLVHPGVWLSARIGDCGGALRTGCLIWSGVIGLWMVSAVLAALVHRARRARAAMGHETG